MIPNSSG